MNKRFLRLLRLIETNGIVDYHKHRIYDTAALLHFLHTPIKSVNRKAIDNGKAYVEKLPSA